ncbi:MAG: LysR family transcriptional regulator [Proteobacteria bacterium]|nr:LysR family transcriptional regulator [Pseudomonadota bacterium]MBS0571973.1 LysR family transcriptional regulator [Pseudomonadota bacterium]
MQIELIETFLDLCESRSFNKTADKLGLTQSTVSGRIQALESVLGRRLFIRSRAGTDLTLEGLKFEPHARALRHAWAEALHATRSAGTAAMTLRVGMQHDLTGSMIGGWVRDFRTALPDTAFYIEADYSPAMASDLLVGALDFGMMYTARMHPDLHFETLGEIAYLMVSTETDRMAGVQVENYILTNFSPAFGQTHAHLHPPLSGAWVSSGESTTVAGLLTSLGGSAYLIEEMAREMVAGGRVRLVADAPPIAQTVYAGVHLRNRHRPMHRRLLQLLRNQFAGRRLSDRIRAGRS